MKKIRPKNYKLTALFKKRSLAAKKGWITRRRNIKKLEVKKRVRIKAARKGWIKRVIQKKIEVKRKFTKAKKHLIKQVRAEIRDELRELRQKNKELTKKLKDLETRKPEKPFVKVIEPSIIEPVKPVPPELPRKKTPDDFLINDPEFAFERGRMMGAMKYLKQKMQDFADGKPFKYEDNILNPPHTDVDIDTAPLADGSVIVQARFSSTWGDDEEEFRTFTLFLESYIHSLGPLFRVSIAQQWDPSKLTVPYEEKRDPNGTLDNKPNYDFYKGLLDIAQNVSLRIADSFDTARDFEGMSKLREKIGYPDYLTVRLVWGESVVRMSRLAAKI